MTATDVEEEVLFKYNVEQRRWIDYVGRDHKQDWNLKDVKRKKNNNQGEQFCLTLLADRTSPSARARHE